MNLNSLSPRSRTLLVFMGILLFVLAPTESYSQPYPFCNAPQDHAGPPCVGTLVPTDEAKRAAKCVAVDLPQAAASLFLSEKKSKEIITRLTDEKDAAVKAMASYKEVAENAPSKATWFVAGGATVLVIILAAVLVSDATANH